VESSPFPLTIDNLRRLTAAAEQVRTEPRRRAITGLADGDRLRRECIMGSRFTETYREASEGRVIPTITGHGYVCGETVLIQQPGDPFRHGIPIGAAE
jgi:proline racemase